MEGIVSVDLRQVDLDGYDGLILAFHEGKVQKLRGNPLTYFGDLIDWLAKTNDLELYFKDVKYVDSFREHLEEYYEPLIDWLDREMLEYGHHNFVDVELSGRKIIDDAIEKCKNFESRNGLYIALETIIPE